MNAFFIGAVAVLGLIAAPAQARTEIACTMQYEPVCGARQVQCIKAPCYPVYETFGNSCAMAAEGATFVHAGECTGSESGPVTEPVPYTPPAHCVAWFDGCNYCSRGPDGSAACTLRACLDEPAAGYCTKYDDPPEPLPVPQPTPEPTPSDGAASATSSTSETAPGFFAALWARLVSFFSWF